MRICIMSFKICTIGCGQHSVFVHGPALRKYAENNSDVHLVACCDTNIEKSENYKNAFGFKNSYRDMHKMLNTERPDVVCIILPVNVTARVAIKVMKLGYPILLEKPPGKNITEVKELIEIADKYKVPNRVAFNRRYTPLVVELKRIINEDLKGLKIQTINYDMLRVNRIEVDFSETAIHAIDTIRFITNSDYKHIYFEYQELSEYGAGVKNIFMNCSMQSGTKVRITISPVTGLVMERATVNLQDNTFLLEYPINVNCPGRLIHIQRNNVLLDITSKDIEASEEYYNWAGFYNESASFFANLRNGKKTEGDLKTSLQSVEVAECIRLHASEYNYLENY